METVGYRDIDIFPGWIRIIWNRKITDRAGIPPTYQVDLFRVDR